MRLFPSLIVFFGEFETISIDRTLYWSPSDFVALALGICFHFLTCALADVPHLPIAPSLDGVGEERLLRARGAAWSARVSNPFCFYFVVSSLSRYWVRWLHMKRPPTSLCCILSYRVYLYIYKLCN